MRHETTALAQPARWSATHVAAIVQDPGTTLPVLPLEAERRVPGMDLWDMWPVETADGHPVAFDDATLWMVLAAPAAPDPEERHDHARIHFLVERAGQWRLGGPVFPDGYTPGSREWSGSALFDPATARLTIFFTAAGRRGQPGRSFEQRLFQASATLNIDAGVPHLTDWGDPIESVAADRHWYMRADQSEGAAGTIKGFRDPALFRDPADGRHYLLFTASCAASVSAWNGVIGMAEAIDDTLEQWRLLPPIVSADGLNNELERPHLRVFDGRYYLFWSTQGKVFAADGPAGPTGLYAMAGDSPFGPFAPVNETGLVAGNPPGAPAQAYSWWVLGDTRANGFVDLPGVADPAAIQPGAERRGCFGGYPSPFFTLSFDDARVTLGVWSQHVMV